MIFFPMNGTNSFSYDSNEWKKLTGRMKIQEIPIYIVWLGEKNDVTIKFNQISTKTTTEQ